MAGNATVRSFPKNIMKNRLLDIYKRLYASFGPQGWWPGDTPFEIAVGAILTQNTNWGNVEKAIGNLKKEKKLSSRAIHEMPEKRLASLIKPAGYYNIKAKRLKHFVSFLIKKYKGSIKAMGKADMHALRESLLNINGIGPETADSILLYGLDKPVFVIDAYTRRVLGRHGIMGHDKTYEDFRRLFHFSLKPDVRLFNEYHALFVRVGKEYCKSKDPLCRECPLGVS
jgi:endonuclease-3 related protein